MVPSSQNGISGGVVVSRLSSSVVDPGSNRRRVKPRFIKAVSADSSLITQN